MEYPTTAKLVSAEEFIKNLELALAWTLQHNMIGNVQGTFILHTWMGDEVRIYVSPNPLEMTSEEYKQFLFNLKQVAGGPVTSTLRLF